MASVAQIQANRSNAQKSTGPRTPQGKAAASQNAVKHGLLAEQVVIHGEDPAEFDLYREGMLAELAPEGTVEAMLAERAVSLAWRLRRAERLQSAVFATVYRENADDIVLWPKHGLPIQPGPGEDEVILGQVVMTDFARAQVLDRLLVHERRIESSLYRTMAQLRKEREARKAGREPTTGAELGSFGADGAEGVSSLKCQVSSEEGPVSGDNSDFTLHTSNLTLEEKITPCGVTTNEEGQASGGSDKRRLRGLSMASSQTQDHGQTSLPMPPGVEARLLSTSRVLAPMSCETNPIPLEGQAGLRENHDIGINRS
ncbi:MAG: hypothetical protein ACM3VT_11600 [Solirubrobacterales bacterium]